jgi:hypothetical protein
MLCCENSPDQIVERRIPGQEIIVNRELENFSCGVETMAPERTIEDIPCPRCGRKSWKNIFSLELSMYVCKNKDCMQPQFHISISGRPMEEVFKKFSPPWEIPTDVEIPTFPGLTANESLFLAGINFIRSYMEKVMANEQAKPDFGYT